MKTKNSTKGSALLTVLGMITVMSIIATMLAYTASQQTRSSIITRDMLKARMIAESGLNKAYHAIKDDFSLATGYTLSEDFSDGSYKVTCRNFSGDKENRAQLTAKGICGLGSAIVGADLENFPLIISSDGSDDSYCNLEHDILVGGPMDISGTLGADVTDIHANGNAAFGGNSYVADNATVSSAGSATWGHNANQQPENVELHSDQPAIEIFPASLQAAIQAFITLAENNDAVYSSGAEIPSNPPGGVAIYTGPDKLNLKGDFTGCIIVLGGAVNVAATTTITGPNGYPSLISLSPEMITVNGGAVLQGAVIAPNASMKFNGGGTIFGPILVGQGLTGNGTADLYAGAGQGFNLPPEESSVDKVIITAWH